MWPQFPDQGSNPGPLPWECGVLATGPPGKYLGTVVVFFFFYRFDAFLMGLFFFFFFFALCSSVWPYSHKAENVISSILHFTDEEREALGLKRLVRDHSGNTYLHVLQNLPPRSVESKAEADEHL